MISVAGASVQTGALAACLIVGITITLIADRLRLTFAAFAFASGVSLIPRVYLFRMAGGLQNGRLRTVAGLLMREPGHRLVHSGLRDGRVGG
jgi:hypothetical protein